MKALTRVEKRHRCTPFTIRGRIVTSWFTRTVFIVRKYDVLRAHVRPIMGAFFYWQVNGLRRDFWALSIGC